MRNRRALASLGRIRRGALSTVMLFVSAACDQRSAELQPRTITLGLAVDTLRAARWLRAGWRDDVPEILDAWKAYLTAVAKTPYDTANTRYWVESERHERVYDLVTWVLSTNVNAVILEVRPTVPLQRDEYVVKTMYSMVEQPTGTDERQLAIGRVYAVRENGRWVFASALNRDTRTWRREAVGPITYVIQPGYDFQRRTAEEAVVFLDSLATAFEVPRVAKLTYYVTRNADDMQRVMGLDWIATLPDGALGYGGGGRVISALPVGAELNRHELVHAALEPLLSPRGYHFMVNEGVAAWYGGTLGLDPAKMFCTFANYLERNPAVTVDSILKSPGDIGTRPAGAVLFALVQEQLGAAGPRQLMASGPSDQELRTTLERLLGTSWAEINRRWKETALALRGDALCRETAAPVGTR